MRLSLIGTKRPFTRLLSLFFICLLPLAAQVTNGTISGYVIDPSGRPIANAEIHCSDAAHSLDRQVKSDGTGFYRCAELAPALYSVSATAPNFEPVTAREARVTVNSQARVDFRLPIAGRKESVDVSASVQPVGGDSAALGAVFDQRRIEGLPLNRRDFLQLAVLTPGVLAPVENSELSSRGAFAMHANGAREEYNNFLLDGVDNNDAYVNRYVLQPSVDAIQEFKISTNSYTAEYGRSAGGQVNVVTRRGANELHGSLYEYLRNRELDARNFFDGAEQPKFVRNQFGFGVGGPVVKNRAFFFVNGDFLRERRGLSRLATVPTAAERRGDLSASGRPIFDPFTRAPFPNNSVPENRISPIGQRVANLFPLPNLPGTAGNYLPQAVLREDQSQSHVRYDQHLTAKDELTLRYGYGLVDLFEPYAEDTDAVPGFGDFVRDTGHNAMIHYQRTVSARTMQSLRLAFNRFSRDIVPENSNRDVAGLLGVSWLRSGGRDAGFPSLSVAGFSRLGDATSLPIFRHANSYQIIEGLSLSRGAHLVKIGADLRHQQLNGTLDLLTRGTLSFSGALAGAGMADLLLGFPSFGLQAQSDNPQTLRTTAYNLYVQDEWRLRPNFTLNAGMRYEYNRPATDPADRMSTLNFTTGQIVRVGTNGVTRSGIHPDRNNFAPRLGFAWNLPSGLMLRAGYGVYYDSGMLVVNSAQYFNPPQFNLRVYFPTATSLLTLANPFPSTGGITPPASLNLLAPDTVGSNLQNWNLSLERRLASLGVLSVAYAGSKGTHLIRSRDINQPAPASGAVQTRRPNPTYGNMLFIDSGSNSSFHSLQVLFHRPLARTLSLWTAYTMSKSIDDASAFLGTKGDKNFPQDSRNYGAERGLSSFDATHRLTLAHIYTLPRSTRWTRDTELRGIATAQSGQPFTPVLRFDNSNTGNTGGNFGSDRPDVLRDPRLSSPSAVRWFDTGAFRVAAPFTFGTAGRNIVRAPGVVTYDVSLVRRFQLAERASLSLEAQAFNAFNHSNLSMPEVYADEPGTFGRIFAAKAPRQLQFALRLHF